MCTTEEQIREKLKDLPEIPCGLIAMREPGSFHGIVEYDVIKGSMISFLLLDHPSCEIYHTHFGRNTELTWHTHGKNSDEVIICLSGEIKVIFEDGTHTTLRETDQCSIKKQITHMAITGSKPTEIIAMTIPKEK